MHTKKIFCFFLGILLISVSTPIIASADLTSEIEGFPATTIRYFSADFKSAKLHSIYQDWVMGIWRGVQDGVSERYNFDPIVDYVQDNRYNDGSGSGNPGAARSGVGYKPQPYSGPPFWANGIGNEFTVSYDSSTGNFTMDMRDQSGVVRHGWWHDSRNQDLPINSIIISVACNRPGVSAVASSLVVTSDSDSLIVADISSEYDTSDNYNQIRVFSDDGSRFGDFVVSGVFTPVWDDLNPPTASVSFDFRVSAANSPPPGYVLNVDSVGQGSVTVDPEVDFYVPGSSVELSAVSDPGWHFVEWIGDASGSINPLSVTMDADKSITAVFEEEHYFLDVALIGDGFGEVTVSPDLEYYLFGDVVDLFASSELNSTFISWGNDVSSSINPLSIVMESNVSLTAEFMLTNVFPNKPEIWGPLLLSLDKEGLYAVVGTDDDLDLLEYRVSWGDGSYSDWLESVPSGTEVEVTHSYQEFGSYDVRAQSRDVLGQKSHWSDKITVVVSEHSNTPPLKPVIVDGCPELDEDVLGDFSALTTDPDDDKISYRFDWADEMMSSWSSFVDSGSGVEMQHSWHSLGNYYIRAQAKDEYGLVSEWSAPYLVSVSDGGSSGENHPPDDPIISGPCRGEYNVKYTFNFSSRDIDFHDVMFVVNWSDGEVYRTEYVASEEVLLLNKTWTKESRSVFGSLCCEKEFLISAKAIDEFGLESNWTNMSVTVPRSFDNPMLSMLFDFINTIVMRLERFF